MLTHRLLPVPQHSSHTEQRASNLSILVGFVEQRSTVTAKDLTMVTVALETRFKHMAIVDENAHDSAKLQQKAKVRSIKIFIS